MLRKFVIEREVPDVGQNTPDGFCAISKKSKDVLDRLGVGIQWAHSYVVDNKTYCIYYAIDESVIREHARLSGFPANKITEVRAIIDPTMAAA